MAPQPRSTPRKTWLVALLLTLLVHALAGVGLFVLRPFAATVVQAKDPEPIQLVFAPPEDASAIKPQTFSELPPDRASEPPDQADLLSNVDSRARDEVPGGDEGSAPNLQGLSDAPHVAIDPGAPGEFSPETGEAEKEQSLQEETEPEVTQGGVLEPRPENPKTSPSMEMLRKRGGSGTASLLQRPQAGELDIYQEEGNQDGNAPSGVVSLNTYAWEYAPWLQRFKRDFVRNWFAPYAFYIGLIHGDNTVRVEIARDGRMLNLEVLQENGDVSLTQSSVSAFNATAPFRPLPDGFPEETLVLTVKLVYQAREPR